MTARHPCPYTRGMEKVFADKLRGCKRVIDVMAGIGKAGLIKGEGFTGQVFANEREYEWAVQGVDLCDVMTVGDARNLPFPSDYFDGAFTSSAYGNRMADSHKAKDASKRITYTHCLGRELSDGNTEKMQFTGHRKASLAYAETHKDIWTEQTRVLKDGSVFVLNVSDHIRKGRRVRTTLWHRLTLKSLGYELQEEIRIPTPRMGFGANRDKRVEYESILVFRLRKGE